jgi:hypothetical protein
MRFINLFFKCSITNIRIICIFLLFAFLLAIGLATYKDYGISWDERVERLDGAANLLYLERRLGISVPGLDSMLIKQDYQAPLDLPSYKDRYYPVGFNLLVEGAIRAININDEQSAYFFRHLITFLIALVGIFAIYRLVERRFHSWQLGLLALTLFIASPRFYAESFYNSKDIVLLALFAVAMNTTIIYLKKTSSKTAILHAIATGLAMNIRLMAAVLVLMTALMLFMQVFNRRCEILTAIKTFALYLFILFCILTIAWPFLWESPFTRLIDAFKFMAHYRFSQDVLYLGSVINSTKLPWHYLPVWILITTPILYSIFWIVGVIATVRNIAEARISLWADDNEMQDLFFLLIFVGPILGFIIFRPVIYDGWRHLYFIYPAFLMLVIRGFTFIQEYCSSSKLGKLPSILMLISILSTASWMVSVHPFQNLYFNTMIGSNWRTKFDLDYWGLSNRRALETILKKDQREKILITDGAYNFLPISLSIINPKDAERIKFTNNANEADYLITNFRLNLTDYSQEPSSWEKFNEIYVGDELVSATYRSKRLLYASDIGLDKSITFSKNGFGQFFLKHSDWANPEDWGAWAIMSKANITFPMSTELSKDAKVLVLTLRALVNKQHPFQKIIISLNGEIQKEVVLSQFEDNLIRLPITTILKSKNQGKDLRLTIDSLDPIRPKDIGIGDDDRLLSIGIVGAKFE